MENSSGIKFVKWTDKRTASMLTTCKNHKCILIKGKPGEMKPNLVFDYNNAKKGVDLSDQMASYYSCLRKTVKWYRKIAIQLLYGAAIVNAYYIHKTWGSGQMSTLEFREKIIDKLLTTEEMSIRQLKDSNPHFMNRYPGIARNVRKRCKECYRKLSERVGTVIAAEKAKRVTTFCPLYDNQPALSIQYFEEIHKKK